MGPFSEIWQAQKLEVGGGREDDRKPPFHLALRKQRDLSSLLPWIYIEGWVFHLLLLHIFLGEWPYMEEEQKKGWDRGGETEEEQEEEN